MAFKEATFKNKDKFKAISFFFFFFFLWEGEGGVKMVSINMIDTENQINKLLKVNTFTSSGVHCPFVERLVGPLVLL